MGNNLSTKHVHQQKREKKLAKKKRMIKNHFLQGSVKNIKLSIGKQFPIILGPMDQWTNGQVGSINRTIKDATVKGYHYKDENVLKQHLESFIMAYHYARSLKSLGGLTPYEKILLYLGTEVGKKNINSSYVPHKNWKKKYV